VKYILQKNINIAVKSYNFLLEMYKIQCTILQLQILINTKTTNALIKVQFMTSIILLYVSAPRCHPHGFW